MSRVIRVAAGLFAAWFAVCVLAFLAMALVPTWPRGLELPWSGFTDFAMHPRGEVLVYLVDYDRVLRYSLAGEFLGSMPAAGYQAGRGRITTTEDGRIILEHMGRIRELAADWTLIRRHWTADRSLSWVLDAEGSVAEGGVERRDPIRPAASGELLFGGLESPPRTEFSIGGATARKKGDSINIFRDGASDVVSIATPWYLVPIRYPLPAGLSFVLAILLGNWLDGAFSFLGLPGPKPPAKPRSPSTR